MKYPITKVLTPSIKLAPLIKTNIQNKVKSSFMKNTMIKYKGKITMIKYKGKNTMIK